MIEFLHFVSFWKFTFFLRRLPHPALHISCPLTFHCSLSFLLASFFFLALLTIWHAMCFTSLFIVFKFLIDSNPHEDRDFFFTFSMNMLFHVCFRHPISSQVYYPLCDTESFMGFFFVVVVGICLLTWRVRVTKKLTSVCSYVCGHLPTSLFILNLLQGK